MNSSNNNIYIISLATAFLSEFLSELGAEAFRKLDQLGFGGRFDMAVLIVLVMFTWILLARPITNLSKRLNPHAFYWNSVVSKISYAISFLLAYLAKSYMASLLRSAQNMAEFTSQSLLALFGVFFWLVICFTIYFEELNSMSSLAFQSESGADTKKGPKEN